MPSVFTKIIAGEIPGRFVWKDDRVVVFLTVNPLKPGHVLVVPREEVDHWIDLPADLAAHLMGVARTVGQALMGAFAPTKIGLTVVGLEVRHVHLHLVPIHGVADMTFGTEDKNPDPAALDTAAEAIRTELRRMGHTEAAG